jgi:hypothetical protein
MFCSQIACSQRLVEQRLCFSKVGDVETFGEPAVDGRQQLAGFGAAALVAAQLSEACGGAQFQELCLLLSGDAQGFALQFLGGLCMPLMQQ